MYVLRTDDEDYKGLVVYPAAQDLQVFKRQPACRTHRLVGTYIIKLQSGSFRQRKLLKLELNNYYRSIIDDR